MNTIKFSQLSLQPEIQETLKEIGYETPTPIQQQAIPVALKGVDILGIAQTGTGKTAAFCLPTINKLYKNKTKSIPKCPKVLILTPTRELAIQIHENLVSYGQNLHQKYAVIFGGVTQGKQVRALKNGAHVLVATPGRLLDLINQKHLNLSEVETFVLDEADRMLDMGFMRDIKKVVPMLPKKRHNMFFSATMPPEIQKLAGTILTNPKKIEVTPESTTVENIKQTAMYVDKENKIDLLKHLLNEHKVYKTLVFVEMKHVANKVCDKLVKDGFKAVAIHGNKTQSARQRAIKEFDSNKAQLLVATDIASRGIDINDVTHVINYELSHLPESYVHRIGRTARAGKEGEAISFVSKDEKSYLLHIEKVTKQTIEIDTDQPFHSKEIAESKAMSVGKAKAKLEAEKRSRRSDNRPKRSKGKGFSKKRKPDDRESSAGGKNKKSSKKKFSSSKPEGAKKKFSGKKSGSKSFSKKKSPNKSKRT